MQRDLPALAGTEFDVVVIGGGICGAAAAWDAAQRGLSTALVEQGDFGAATSANSLKVVHSGIRYLQHLDVRRIRESSRERTALLRIAPHLVHPLPVVVPAFGHNVRGPEALAAAFLVFNSLTWDRNSGLLDPERRIPSAHLISRRQLLDWHPGAESPQLTGGGVFWDGQLSNPPRLVWEFLRTAARAGAVVANYAEVIGFLRSGPRISGVIVHDCLNDERLEVRARVVVNAAGPFAGQLNVRAGLGGRGRLPVSRDLALVIRRPLVRNRALALQTKYRDPSAILSRGPRHLFMVPWRGATLIGVNSIIYQGDPYNLTSTDQEVQGFLDEINASDPSLRLTFDDVALVHAGLLPIEGGNLAHGDISFGKRPLLVDNAKEDGIEGLITAVTNRYTVARLVAEHAVDLAFRKLGKRAPHCRTAETPLLGANFGTVSGLVRDVIAAAGSRLTPEAATRLAWNYGSSYGDILQAIPPAPDSAKTLGTSETLKAEVVHAVREEMAVKLADCVFRRTELGTAGDPGREALEACAGLMGSMLSWNAGRIAAELSEVQARFPCRAGTDFEAQTKTRRL
ncbi:MAG TPA: FAD-dependent oxidoreductase [Gemmatimonadales bacterium]|nr:FAD-dependent oxidoreductase [Gemmatimonadales bacterium]